MTEERVQYLRCDPSAVADWLVRFLTAPDGSAGHVSRAVAADTGEHMILLSFGEHEVAVDVQQAGSVIRTLIKHSPATAAGLCMAIQAAIDDIPTTTLH